MAVVQDNIETDETVERPSATPRSGRRGATFETLAVCGFIFGIFAMTAAVFAVGLAARAVTVAEGGGGGSSAAATEAPTVQSVTLGDFFIDPDEATVDSGAVLDLTNEGAVDHDLAIDDVVSDLVAPGETGTFDTSGVEPGTYEWYCSVPGHKEAGMTGTVTVG